MKDKAGNQITIKEFFQKWKKGIENITPTQKLSSDIDGTFVTLLGYVFALVAVIINIETIGLLAYALILIFIGSTWTQAVKWLSLRQQYKYMKSFDVEAEIEKAEIVEEAINKTIEDVKGGN